MCLPQRRRHTFRSIMKGAECLRQCGGCRHSPHHNTTSIHKRQRRSIDVEVWTDRQKTLGLKQCIKSKKYLYEGSGTV